MKRSLEADDPISLGMSRSRHGLADDLNQPFVGFCTRVAEEHTVGERRAYEPLCKPLRFRNAVKVRDVHNPSSLSRDGGHEARVIMSE